MPRPPEACDSKTRRAAADAMPTQRGRSPAELCSSRRRAVLSRVYRGQMRRRLLIRGVVSPPPPLPIVHGRPSICWGEATTRAHSPSCWPLSNRCGAMKLYGAFRPCRSAERRWTELSVNSYRNHSRRHHDWVLWIGGDAVTLYARATVRTFCAAVRACGCVAGAALGLVALLSPR